MWCLNKDSKYPPKEIKFLPRYKLFDLDLSIISNFISFIKVCKGILFFNLFLVYIKRGDLDLGLRFMEREEKKMVLIDGDGGMYR